MMQKPHLALACLAIVLAPPLVVLATNAGPMFVEDRQHGRLLYFSENR